MLEKEDLLYGLRRSTSGHQWANGKLTVNVDICDCPDIMFSLADNGLIDEDGIKITLFEDYVEFTDFERILGKAGYSVEEMHCVFY